MRRADRLFQIIQILRRSTRPVTGAAMAMELEVSARTIYRDIAALMAERVPIVGEAGFGYLLAEGYDLPPLMLTPAELEAIALGAQWVAGRQDAQLAAAARDVLIKIEAMVPPHLRPYIAAPSTGVRPPLAPPPNPVSASLFREAIRRRLRLHLTYRSEAGDETARTVWPIILGYSDTQNLLVAWCELRQDFRHFRTDRIISANILDQPIPEPHAALLRRFEAWRAAQLAGRPSPTTDAG